jgi:hypothetical protein
MQAIEGNLLVWIFTNNAYQMHNSFASRQCPLQSFRKHDVPCTYLTNIRQQLPLGSGPHQADRPMPGGQ